MCPELRSASLIRRGMNSNKNWLFRLISVLNVEAKRSTERGNTMFVMSYHYDSVCKRVINVASCSTGNFTSELFLKKNTSVAVPLLRKVRDHHPVCPVQLLKLYVICQDTTMNLSQPCKGFVNGLEQLPD